MTLGRTGLVRVRSRFLAYRHLLGYFFLESSHIFETVGFLRLIDTVMAVLGRIPSVTDQRSVK